MPDVNQNKPQETQTEEVDLGQLFKAIGNLFERFFNFIASIFKSLFKVLIIIAVHFSRRIYWYLTIVIVGFAIGSVLDKKMDKLYGANLFVETNFDSQWQLFETIKYLNQLATEEDSLALSKQLELTPSEAATLKGFYMEAQISIQDHLKEYSTFRKSLDSLSQIEMTFEKYYADLDASNFTKYMIGVASTDRNIYPKLRGKLIDVTLKRNEFLEELRKVNLKNYQEEVNLMGKQESELDSLIKSYLEIRERESKKEPTPGAGTNLFMGNAAKNDLLVNESSLLWRKIKLDSIRSQARLKITKNSKIINVLADFPDSGYEKEGWQEKKKYIVPLILFLLTLVIFSFIELRKYLIAREKELYN